MNIDILRSDAAAFREYLKPTDELSLLSARSRPPVAWGSASRIQIGSPADARREQYRDNEWGKLRKLARALQILAGGVPA